MDEISGEDVNTVNWEIFNGVKIRPNRLVFANAYEGKSFREKIVFQNVSTRPVTIRTMFAPSFSFKLDRNLFGEKLSCGLSITLWVSHTYTHGSAMQVLLTVFINNCRKEFIIETVISRGEIYCMPRNLNFGMINIGYRIHVQKLWLHNKGSRQTKFEFDVTDNSVGLTIIPRKGFIAAKDFVEVEIDFIGSEEGIYSRDIWVKCENPFRFNLYVEVIRPRLYITSQHEYTQSFLPIMLPPTFGGCRVAEYFRVFNYNVLETNFIIVPEYNFEIMSEHKVKEIDPRYNLFFFNPIEGDLDPNDKKNIEISFAPKMKKTIHDVSYFVCFRLIRLECQTVDKIMREHILKRNVVQNKQSIIAENKDIPNFSIEEINPQGSEDSIRLRLDAPEISFSEFIRICVYAKVRSVKVEFEPQKFDLNEMLIDTTKTKNLKIHNKSALPIFFGYAKVACIRIEPTEGRIESNGTAEVTVTFHAKAAGTIENSIQFRFYSHSQIAGKETKALKLVGSFDLPVHIPVKSVMKTVSPKFVMGLTPLHTNQVGYLTQDIRFNSNITKPKMSILSCYKTNPNKKLDNAIIAFPNDRPKVLRPWRETKIACKTIFAGVPRVVAPRDEYMLSEEETIKKLQNCELYYNYIQSLRENRQRRKPETVFEDYVTSDKKLFQTVKQLVCPRHWKTVRGYHHEDFVELKPIQIYFVKISPQKIRFGPVVVNSAVKYTLEIFNENTFPVHILITSFHRHDSILPGFPIDMIITSNEKINISREFYPNSIETFYSVLNVYLNFHHAVPVLIHAEIIRPVISLDFNVVTFNNTCNTKIIPLKNVLNVPIKFTWELPKDACYHIQPLTGVIPSGRLIYCEIRYVPEFGKRNCLKYHIHCENGSTVYVQIVAETESYVEILEPTIEIPNIPINTLIKREMILRNEGRNTVLFRIRNTYPCYGITIQQEKGSILAKSDFKIFIDILIDVFVKFECRVDVEFETGQSTSFSIVGAVDCPNIVCKPNILQFKRIPVESYDILPLSIENRGMSVVHLSFPKTNYPEFTVSTSSRIDIDLTKSTELVLEPKEVVNLFVHFFPLDVCMNEIYLPMVINHIFGPSDRTDDTTVEMYTFIKSKSENFEEPNMEIIQVKKKMPLVKLVPISTKHVLRFSKTNFSFRYFTTCPENSVIKSELKVKNCTKQLVEFCLDIKDVYPNYDLDCKNKDAITYEDADIIGFYLNEDEELLLEVIFIPNQPGEYNANIAIYIKDIKDGAAFNFIKLQATYPPPLFHSPRWYFLDPVPLSVAVYSEIKIRLANHFANCHITFMHSELLDTQIMRSEVISIFQREVVIKVTFSSNVPIAVYTKLGIDCTCDAHTFIIFGVCANEDICTTYAHYCPTIPTDTIMHSRGYPYFPTDSDNSAFANYMRKCLNVVEKWLCEQMFSSNHYFLIPEDMPGYCRSDHGKKKGTKSKVLILFQFLTYVGGSSIAILNLDEPEPQTQIERVNSIHCKMKRIVLFLNMCGANIYHVRSRYLLKYDDYILYMTKIRKMKHKSQQEVKCKEMFIRRAKQCWLDLILSIFQIMILPRITTRKEKSNKASILKDKRCSSSNMIKDRKCSSLDKMTNDREGYSLLLSSTPEQSLLSWIDMAFCQNTLEIVYLDPDADWNTLEIKRNVTNYTSDFADGIVLIGITIHFCPYLKPYLNGIYAVVDSPEMAYHNAIMLVEAWKLIKCSFNITPQEIVEPVAIQMILLCQYIYDVFSTLTPKDEVYYYVSLGSKDTKQIIIRNTNSTDLHYEIRFIQDSLECFTVIPNELFIKIAPGKTHTVIIQYWCKTIEPQNATILFCGDNPGEPYCKNLVYHLCGTSNFLGAHAEMVYEIDLYKSKQVECIIQSPYPGITQYETLYAKVKPENLKPENLIPIRKHLATLRPRIIYAEDPVLKTDIHGVGKSKIYLSCMSANPLESTIVFSSPEYGEFFVSLTMDPINFDSIQRHHIPVTLPSDWFQRECICCNQNHLANRNKCPKRIIINIPCKNDQFWNVIIESFMQCIPANEKDIWKKVLCNYILYI